MLGLSVPTILSRIIILVISLTFHEFSHAITADAFGDDTPRVNGRLTLNPAAHLDPIGSLMLLFAGFGWARPTPINPYVLQRRSPAAVMWVSLAGPASNLLLALLATIPLKLGIVPFDYYSTGGLLPTPFRFLLEFISINLLLMVFNLIPLAPLDGEKIADYLLPPAVTRVLDTIRPYGPAILLLLVFVGPLIGIDVIGWVLYPIMHLFGRLLGIPL